MIYLLEDDQSIRELVCYTLTKNELCATGFSTPSEFWEGMRSHLPRLILLDIMLPEQDGISILRTLRGDPRTEDIPVIMLTARSDEYNKIISLDIGADDYITKPFGIMELVARVKAVLRRTKRADMTTNAYKISDVSVDMAKREVTVNGECVALTFKEFELFAYLLENRPKVLSREKIHKKIWGYDFDGENRTVDVHVRTLRSKLGAYADLIETVRGVGYRIGEHKE